MIERPMNWQQTACFGIGFAAAIILLVLGVARYKRAYPMAFTDPPLLASAYRTATSEAEEEPTYSTNAWGLVMEKSLSSREKTETAVKKFTERVTRTGLLLSVHGDLEITVYSGKGKVVRANAQDTHFGVHYREGEAAAVDTMQKRGEDANGIPRDPWSVITASGVNTNWLATWADPAKYPIQTALDAVKPNVLALVESMDVGGTNRYLLESAIRLQMGTHQLPFYRFMFTTAEFYGQSARINREDLLIPAK